MISTTFVIPKCEKIQKYFLVYLEYMCLHLHIGERNKLGKIIFKKCNILSFHTLTHVISPILHRLMKINNIKWNILHLLCLITNVICHFLHTTYIRITISSNKSIFFLYF